MNSMDREVLTAVDSWLDAGFACRLITIVQTWGSSPRPQGAMMAIRSDGLVAGSVSGGCIEDDLIERASDGGSFAATPELLTYGIESGDAHRFGLPCGGTIRLACETLSQASGIKEVLARLECNELVARTLDLASGRVAVGTAGPEQKLVLQDGVLTNTFGPRWRLIIIGA
ncbi:MAG: XdhC family protein, partial [Telluria sp.]